MDIRDRAHAPIDEAEIVEDNVALRHTPRIDPAAVERLAARDGAPSRTLPAHLIERYARAWDRDREILQRALEHGDGERVRDVLRRLRSASADLGAARLAMLCQQAEIAVEGGRLAGVWQQLERLQAEHASALDILAAASRAPA